MAEHTTQASSSVLRPREPNGCYTSSAAIPVMGLMPAAGLINVNGTFYGTTTQGGQYDWGTIFSITPDGTEHVLHNFGRGNDGRYPQGALLYANGTLYGTTTWGGKYETAGAGDHSGTVFALTLPK